MITKSLFSPSALFFISTSGRGLSFDYPSITLHAISRADSGPSLYCQLDDSLEVIVDDAGSSDHGDTAMRELIIIPRDKDNCKQF